MSQLWHLLHRDSTSNTEQTNDYHEFHDEQTINSSTSSGSTIEIQKNANPQDSSNTFNSQLKKKLVNLKFNKAKKSQQQLLQEQSEDDDPNGTFQPEIVGETSNDKCLIDDFDENEDQIREIRSPITIKSDLSLIQPSFNNPTQYDSNVLISPSSMSSINSSSIFERSVQDPIPSFSNRRDSSSRLQRSQSYSSQSSIPSHLNVDFYIPSVLDATTEVLTDKDTDLNTIKVITPSKHTNVLQNSCNNSTTSFNSKFQSLNSSGPLRRKSIQPLTRRPSCPISISGPVSPLKSVDYSDKKKLNFCSFADLLSDESSEQFNDSVNKFEPGLKESKDMRSNSNVSNYSFAPLSKTSSIKDILLENEARM